MRSLLAGAAAVCLLLFAAGDAVSVEPVRSEKILFENGMRLIVAEMPASDMVSVYGFVNVGSTMEGPFLGTGLSHFLEHMIFKGTLTRKPGDIPNEIQSLGGVFNASTGLDYTIYTITVPAVSFSKGLDILADMLMNAVIDEGEFGREKEVVLSELKMYKDSPDRCLSEMVFSHVYRTHPYKVPIIGYESLLRSLTAQQMKQHYQKFYAPNNIVLVVAGGIKKDEVAPQVRTAFGKFERTPVSLRDFPQEPAQKGPRFYSEGYPTPLTRMSLAYRGVNVFHDDMAALDALAMVLGQGASSRLYRELVQRQSLVQSVSASNFTPVDDGVFEIEVSFMDVPLEQVREAVLEQVRLIQRSGISKEELLKAKKAVWKDYWQRQETSSSLAYDLAVSEGLFGDSSFSLRYAKAFDRLTVKEVQQAARRYLVDERLTVTALVPKDQESAGPGSDLLNFDKDAVDAVRLDNGMTVLLRQNPTLPFVQAVLVFNAGVGQEDEAKNGISNLFTDVWVQGTRRFSAERLHALLEKEAISLSAFAGRNSVGLSMSMMDKDVRLGLELLADVVLNPVLSEEELRKSRQRIHTSISARDDDLLRAAQRLFLEKLFAGHPARLTELGTHESVEALSREDVLAYYRSYVKPNNAVLSVFGNFDRDAVLKQLTSLFGGMTRQEVDIRSSVPTAVEAGETSEYFDKEQAAVIMGAQAVGFYHEDRYTMEVLAAILGSPFRGRIFNVIREQMGASYRLGGGFQPLRDTGYILFQVLTSPERAQEVKEALHGLIRELREKPVDEDLLQSTKAYLIGSFRRTKETDSGFSFMTALDELYGLGWDSYKRYEERINSVTAEDIQGLAQTYLGEEKLFTLIGLPKPQQEP